MNQRINFYSDAYRPKVDYLSLNLCAIYLGALLACADDNHWCNGLVSNRFEMSSRPQSPRQERMASADHPARTVIESRAKDPALELTAIQLERDQKDKLTLAPISAARSTWQRGWIFWLS